MKRSIARILSLTVALAVAASAFACAKAPKPVAQPTPTPEITATPSLPTETPVLDVPPARMYGETVELVVDRDGFFARVRYPAGEIEPLNAAVSAWAPETCGALLLRSVEATWKDGVRATVDVEYDAYAYNGRYIGVKEHGVYVEPGSDIKEWILLTYNYDLYGGELQISDVIGQEHRSAVLKLVSEKLSAVASSVDPLSREDLEVFVVRDDGIEWPFVCDDGIVSVLLTYAELADFLCWTAPLQTPTLSTTPEVAPRKPAIVQLGTCLYDGAQVRAQPDKDATLLGSVEADTQIEIVKADAVTGWHMVWYQGRTAYIYAKLVRLASAPEPATAFVTCERLPVRAQPSEDSELLGVLAYQEQVAVLQRSVSGNWAQILYNGQIAYVCNAWIQIGDKPAATPDPATATAPLPEPVRAPSRIDPVQYVTDDQVAFCALGVCMADGVIVRALPYAASDYYGTLSAGNQVYILETGPVWLTVYVYVNMNGGYIGYVPAAYVS